MTVPCRWCDEDKGDGDSGHIELPNGDQVCDECYTQFMDEYSAYLDGKYDDYVNDCVDRMRGN